jgi:hypothetical protein
MICSHIDGWRGQTGVAGVGRETKPAPRGSKSPFSIALVSDRKSLDFGERQYKPSSWKTRFDRH